MIFNLFPLISAACNLAGSILIAFSIGRHHGGAHEWRNGKMVYIASIRRPHFFGWGIVLIIIGFIIQVLYYLPLLFK
jgi:hypothetical protein